MCTGSYGWFRCEKVKWRSKIKSVFNFFSVQFGTTEEESKAAAPVDTSATNAENKYKEMVVTLENGVQTIHMNRPTKYNAITLEVK